MRYKCKSCANPCEERDDRIIGCSEYKPSFNEEIIQLQIDYLKKQYNLEP